MTELLKPFQRFSVWVRILFGELANNIISLIYLGVVYFALWHFPQTVDLLLILNQADAFLLEVPLYFTLLTASAFLIWNIPKYTYYHNYKDIKVNNFIGFEPNQHYKFQQNKLNMPYAYVTRVHMRKTVPRILAILLLLISSLAILNAMRLFELKNVYTQNLNPDILLLFFSVLFLLFLEPRVYRKIQSFFLRLPRVNLFFLGISILLILFIISLGSLNTQAEKDLGKLFVSNFALFLLFFILTFNSLSFLNIFPRKVFYAGVLLLGFAILTVFLIFNFFPGLSTEINPLSILIICLTSIYMICFILILIGKKIKLPLLTIVFFLGILSNRFIYIYSDHYNLEIIKSNTTERQNIEDYVYNWVASREEKILNHDKVFPILLVSSEGGGSRAGLWSFLVNSYLYEESDGKYFTDHLFSLTGASGGSVGNSMFFAEARAKQIDGRKANFRQSFTANNSILKYKASAIYKQNFLSESLLSLLGRDLFKETTSLFTFKNRGQLLEDQWKNSFDASFNTKQNLLNNDLNYFYALNKTNSLYKTVPPLLMINTTHTQTGNYNVISPVKFRHNSFFGGIQDFTQYLQKSYPEGAIALSTAMRINASFPYVTPVGEVKNMVNGKSNHSDQYADAGYYDNIGGVISKGMEQVLKKIINDSFPEIKNKVLIKHLIINNDEDRKIVSTQSQFAAPLTTLRNVRYGHTNEIMKKLSNSITISLKPTLISPLSNDFPASLISKEDDNKPMIKPVLPLGRYLSTIAIRSIEARLEEIEPELKTILNSF